MYSRFSGIYKKLIPNGDRFDLNINSDNVGCGEKQFSAFRKKVLHKERKLVRSVTPFLYELNLYTVRITSFLMIGIDLFWIFLDIFNQEKYNLLEFSPLFGIILQIVVSLYMIFLSYKYKNRGKKPIVRISFLLFYLANIVSIVLLAISKNQNAAAAGVPSAFVGVPLSTFYFFILAFMPLPHQLDSIIVAVAAIASAFVPMYCPGKEAYSFSQNIVLRVTFLIVYGLYMGMHMRIANTAKRTEDLNETLLIHSYCDELTGSLNRRALDTCWKFSCENEICDSIGVVIFDVDDFKQYNDHYTHTKGDEVLRSICGTVMAEISPDEGFLFRYGGEEFVMIVPNATKETLTSIAGRARKAVWDSNIPREDVRGSERVSITAGCAIQQVSGSDDAGADFITNADKQLYIGKDCGKNCVVFDGEAYR